MSTGPADAARDRKAERAVLTCPSCRSRRASRASPMRCAVSSSRSEDGAKRRLHVSDAEPRSLRSAVRGTTHALWQARACTLSRCAARIGRRLIGRHRCDQYDTTAPAGSGGGSRVWLGIASGGTGALGVLHAVLSSTAGAERCYAYQGRQCSPVRFGSLGGRGLRPRGARYNISTAVSGRPPFAESGR